MPEKVCIFKGNSAGPIDSHGAVFLSTSYNESSPGQKSPNEGGVSCETQCGGWRAVVDCGLGDIREGCNCTGHVAIWEKQL